MKNKLMGVILSLLLIVAGRVASQTPSAPLHLSVDHFSRTIAPQDTVRYLIEAFVEGNKAVPVTLHALPDTALNVSFSTNQVITPALVRMKVFALFPGHSGNHILSILAQSADNMLRDTLRVWLHFVKGTVAQRKLFLDVPPGNQLEKNVPQTLEGAIIPAPASPGAVIKINLRAPNAIKDTIVTTAADKMGLFHVNHVFKKHGQWRAFASWHGSGSDSAVSPSIFFLVKRSPLRITVAADKRFRDTKNPETLRVFGQITPDYADATIKIEVQRPDDLLVAKDVLPEANGKFSANFPANKSGIYHIKATALGSFGSLKPISESTKYASSAPLPLPFPPTSVAVHVSPIPTNGGSGSASSCALTEDVPSGYAMIVIGQSNDYFAHLNMAMQLRAALIIYRGFRPEDILLRTLYLSSDPTDLLSATNLLFEVDTDVATLKDGIRERLLDATDATNNPNFSLHQGLLFFWIGNTSPQDPSNPNSSLPRFHAGRSVLIPNEVAEIYTTAMRDRLWKRYNKGVVVVNAGTGSGRLMDVMPSLPPSGYIFAGTNSGNNLRTEDKSSIVWTPAASLPGSSPPIAQALAINLASGDIFAGTSSGSIYRSINNGDGWSAVTSLPGGAAVQSLAINASGHIFAGTPSGNVYRSTDNGVSWPTPPVGTLPGGAAVQSLAINASGHIFAGTPSGNVYRSTDNGVSWPTPPVGTLPGGAAVQSLAINASGHIFAGTPSGNFYRSTDNGVSWPTPPVGTLPGGAAVQSLAINASGHIFAGTPSGNVYRSTDNGVSWPTFTNLPGSPTVQALAIDPSVPFKHCISSLPWTGPEIFNEPFMSNCGNTTFSRYFIEKIAHEDVTVRGAFKLARARLSSRPPAIDDDGDGIEESPTEIDQADYGEANDAAGQIKLGCYLNSTTLLARIQGVFFTSVINSPQLDSIGTVHVALDNPNNYRINRVTVSLSNADSLTTQCFELKPVEVASLWKARVNYNDPGYYRGLVQVEYDADGYTDIATETFERFRHDTTTAPPTTPPQDGNGFTPNFGVNFGVDVNSTSSVSKGTGSVGVTLFSYGQPGKTGYVAFPLLSVGADLNRQWISLSPIALNVGNTFAEGKILSKIWLHGGVGYVIHDKSTPSTKGDVILVGGVRTGF